MIAIVFTVFFAVIAVYFAIHVAPILWVIAVGLLKMALIAVAVLVAVLVYKAKLR